jgi:hypothetical protein
MYRASPSGEQHEQWLDNGLARSSVYRFTLGVPYSLKADAGDTCAIFAGTLCARTAFLLLHMPWYGALLWQHDGNDLRICCQYDHGRRGWELPKGGQEPRRRASSGVPDSSPFATARHEMWEEVGVWLAWRPPGAYDWVTQKGAPLPWGPGPQQDAFVVTKLRTEDEQAVSTHRRWINLEECGRRLRSDHLSVALRQVVELAPWKNAGNDGAKKAEAEPPAVVLAASAVQPRAGTCSEDGGGPLDRGRVQRRAAVRNAWTQAAASAVQPRAATQLPEKDNVRSALCGKGEGDRWRPLEAKAPPWEVEAVADHAHTGYGYERARGASAAVKLSEIAGAHV